MELNSNFLWRGLDVKSCIKAPGKKLPYFFRPLKNVSSWQEPLDELSSEESSEQQQQQQQVGRGEMGMENKKLIGFDKEGEKQESGELCENLDSLY